MDPEPINLFFEGGLPEVTTCYGKWKVLKKGNSSSYFYLELYDNGYT